MKTTLLTLIWQFVSCKVIWIIKFFLYLSCYSCIIRLVPRVTLGELTSLLNHDIMLDLLSVFHYATQFKFFRRRNEHVILWSATTCPTFHTWKPSLQLTPCHVRKASAFYLQNFKGSYKALMIRGVDGRIIMRLISTNKLWGCGSDLSG